jgi:hypothetical protein
MPMTKRSTTSRKRGANELPATEADRRFALLVALMTPDDSLEKHDSAESDGRVPDEQPTALDEVRSEDVGERDVHLNWRRWNVVLFAGCALAAALFIVATSFIKL